MSATHAARLRRIGLVLLLLAVFGVLFVSRVNARYVTAETGSAAARTAAWNVEIAGQACAEDGSEAASGAEFAYYQVTVSPHAAQVSSRVRVMVSGLPSGITVTLQRDAQTVGSMDGSGTLFSSDIIPPGTSETLVYRLFLSENPVEGEVVFTPGIEQVSYKKKLRSWVGIAVILLIALILVFCLLVPKLGGEAESDLPMPLGFGLSLIMSGSMTPTLNVNDVAVIVPAKSYEVGDIVVFRSDMGLTIHRIIALDGDRVTTKGDYVGNSPDAPFDASAICGKMLFAIPKIGIVLTWVTQPIVFVVLACVALLLLILSFRRKQ